MTDITKFMVMDGLQPDAPGLNAFTSLTLVEGDRAWDPANDGWFEGPGHVTYAWYDPQRTASGKGETYAAFTSEEEMEG